MYAGVIEGRDKCGVGIIVAQCLANCVSERCVMVRLWVAEE